jgi:hypothetical protein
MHRAAWGGSDVTRVDWRIEALDLSCCNCDWGCPCQFMSSPTRGHCRAAAAFHVERGHFGNTRLDGLTFGGLFAWPGPIHEGNGEALPLIDERASAAQRSALLSIMSGEETEPGATLFNVFAATFTKVHDPQFVRAAFTLDLERRTGHFRLGDLVVARSEPLLNPVTGAELHSRIVLPEGFEFLEAEVASSSVQTQNAPITLEWSGRHAHLARVDMTGNGLVKH